MILKTLEGKFKTVAHLVEETLVKLFQEEPKIEQTAVATISALAPVVVAIVAATGNEPEAIAIAGVVTLVKNDMAVVQVTLNQAGAGTANVTVKSLLAAITANLASLLTAGMIKDPATLAKVNVDVNSIDAALSVLIAAL